MLFTIRLFLMLFMCVTVPVSSLMAEPLFSHDGVAGDARRYENYLKSKWSRDKRSAAELKAAAAILAAKDPRAASGLLASIVANSREDSDTWLRLARMLLAIPDNPRNSAERYDIPVHASGAAYMAYQDAGDDKSKAEALFVLGQALKRRSYWRPAIEAYKASVELSATQKAREAYDKLRATRGFRLTDYRVENELTAPRVCIEFSEYLSRAVSDFSTFVSVDGKDPSNVVSENQELCVEGLAHGSRYQVQVRAGLPSSVGENLLKTSDLAIYVPDRSPFVRFEGKAYVLPSRGQNGIPVVSTNTSEIKVKIFRIGDRGLVQELQSGGMERQFWRHDVNQLKDRAIKVYEGSMDVTSKLNQDVTTAIPVTDATGPLQPGAYVVIAEPSEKTKGQDGRLATQWFIVSDLGLTAFTGDDGIHAFVRSLSDAEPVAGSQIKLVARSNEILGTATTDNQGYAKFDPGLSKGEGGAQPAVLIAEKGDGEYAFLNLTDAAFDLSDRGVKGRAAAGPIDAYLYTERGVYRGGEEINLSALVRTNDGKAATLPTTLIVKRPDGVEHKRIVLNDQGLGGRTASIVLAKTAMRGTWRFWLHTDPTQPAIAERSVLVEDFVPERLDMTIASPAKSLRPGDVHKLSADGHYLYGPPASDLALEGEVVVRLSKKDVKGYDGYSFGVVDETVSPVRQPLPTNLKMDENGKATFDFTLPSISKTARPLAADIMVKLLEPGGRSIERKLTLPVDARQKRIGIKPLFENNRAEQGEVAAFNVVALDADGGQSKLANLKWTLTRIDRNWQWYRRNGNWSYDAVTVKKQVADGSLATQADQAVKIEQLVNYGRYQLDVFSTEPNGPASRVIFTAGWHTSGDAIDSPELLEVALDKATYKSGETAELRIASKDAGKALIAVLGNKLHQIKTVDVPAGGGSVSLTVDDDWGSGVYVTALFYRAMDEANKRMPARAIGVSWLGIDQSARTLDVSMTLPEKVKSDTTLSVPVTVEGLAAGEQAYITVAAVDVGILNLTGFKSPAPEKWFNAQQKMSFSVRDFYGRLIDGMRAERGSLKSGGDGTGPVMQGNPTVETVLSLFSGVVRVDDNGQAKVVFDLPDFNGTVRFMAVAWSNEKIGHGSADMVVRNAVALTISAPRFMTLGDEIQLGFDIHNIEGPEAGYKLTLSEISGDDTSHIARQFSSKTLDLKTGARKLTRIAFSPDDVGKLTLRAEVSGPGDVAIKRDMTFDVLPPAGDVKRTTIASVAGNGGSLSISRDLVQDLIPSRTVVNVSAGPAARFDVPTLLTILDRYPYGCAEQTVSRALPLLYVNDVAERVGIAKDKALKKRITQAVARVFELQNSSGAFGTWGPSSADMWLTAYVTDFLTRARETGVDVQQHSFNRALDRLQNFLNYAGDFEKGGEDRAYALYVLARNGRAPIGELRYYADTRLDRFASPLAKAQIGAALAMMGDKQRAERVFGVAAKDLDDDQNKLVSYRSDYGSALRDRAGLLTLVSETGVAADKKASLAEVIAKAYESRSHTSTQEQAWLLLAAHAMNDSAADLKMSFDGVTSRGPVTQTLTPAQLADGELLLKNESSSAVDAVVSVVGASMMPEPAVEKGFQIVRRAYSLDGKPVDLASLTGGDSTVRQNERFVMVVQVTSEEQGGRVLVVDRLPAGFEIENPKLVASGSINGLDWLKSTKQPEHTEFRDNRFVAAFNFGSAKKARKDQPVLSATLAYIVRAVTPGRFVHPAATVEDMYRPERYARTAAGQLSVQE